MVLRVESKIAWGVPSKLLSACDRKLLDIGVFQGIYILYIGCYETL